MARALTFHLYLRGAPRSVLFRRPRDHAHFESLLEAASTRFRMESRSSYGEPVRWLDLVDAP